MTKSTLIHQNVTISSIGFRGEDAYPRRMEFGGCTYHFVDAGLRMIVKRGGERIAQIFTMSDGSREYCLRKEHGGWTLLSICG